MAEAVSLAVQLAEKSEEARRWEDSNRRMRARCEELEAARREAADDAAAAHASACDADARCEQTRAEAEAAAGMGGGKGGGWAMHAIVGLVRSFSFLFRRVVKCTGTLV